MLPPASFLSPKNQARESPGYILALEGGGTRSQAVLMDFSGSMLQSAESTDVNTNFIPQAQAGQAMLNLVGKVLRGAQVQRTDIRLFASSLVGARLEPERFAALCPNATFHQYREDEVIFARAGFYLPHGVAVVAATGATAFGVRSDTNQQLTAGGWGSLLGDEGSAYALGLSALRLTARISEGRVSASTRLVSAICQHYDLREANFRSELVILAYQKPLSRTEIAGLAPVITRLAKEGDPIAEQLTAVTAADLADLALHVCRSLFSVGESFDLVVAGGLTNAGELILSPLQQSLEIEFPRAAFHIGREEPAVALGKLALYHMHNGRR
jgi:N-acetylglucosamine kinase-like BadF-type ATPase